MSLLAWSFLEFRVATNVRKLTGSKRIYFWQVVQKQESRVHLAFCHQCILYIHDISLHFIIMWFDILYLYRTIVCNHISKCSYPHIMFTNSHGLFFFMPRGSLGWAPGCCRWAYQKMSLSLPGALDVRDGQLCSTTSAWSRTQSKV